jgi:hypothetical protein
MRGGAVFVNGRLVELEALSRLVEECYDRVLLKGEKPMWIASIEVPPSMVDPNVHPRKAEVGVTDRAGLLGAVRAAVREHLGHSGDAPVRAQDAAVSRPRAPAARRSPRRVPELEPPDVCSECAWVGHIDGRYVLFSEGGALFMGQIFQLLRAHFFDVLMDSIGNFEQIRFARPLSIAALRGNPCDFAGHEDFLRAAFAIEVADGCLLAMPEIVRGYMPSYAALPLFVCRLPTQVDWSDSEAATRGIASELAMLYALLPEEEGPTAKRVLEEFRHVVLPDMAKRFRGWKRLREQGWLKGLATVQGLYTVFERT